MQQNRHVGSLPAEDARRRGVRPRVRKPFQRSGFLFIEIGIYHETEPKRRFLDRLSRPGWLIAEEARTRDARSQGTNTSANI